MELINRELSWLCFNERVLQEALDEKVPVVERMRFLGIYSNNMDEFFRVRVANLRRMIQINKKEVEGFKGSPSELYSAIRKVVLKQRLKFEVAYKKILEKLEEDGIFHLDESSIADSMKENISRFFHDTLKHAIVPIILDKRTPFPRLLDSAIYLAVKMTENKGKVRYALIQIPGEFNRFFILHENGRRYVILLDDIIRIHLRDIFPIFEIIKIEAYTFKFTRDAELDLDDDISISLLEKIEKSIKNRKKGIPVRFVYDDKMPKDLLDHLLKALNLKFGLNTIPGGKYHNFKDFISFPNFNNPTYVYPSQPPVVHPSFIDQRSLIKAVMNKDILLHFPYQQFDHVVDLLREAAIDPKVRIIRINVYRVASQSQVMNALLAAVHNGKQVEVVLELQARFDEENNLIWSNRLKEAGAKVIFGAQHMKIHSKLLQIVRDNGKKEHLITYVGTGNFNERSSRIYSDLALITADPSISREVSRVFKMMDLNMDRSAFKLLHVSPLNTRRKLTVLIDNEIRNAKKGLPSGIRIKLNNLTDQKMIKKLYEASKAGVKIEMIIRGICCLVPGAKDISENITVISIVDRYLEHARFMVFHNNGAPQYFLSSADWMERNLDKRIEVGCPILDPDLQKELDTIFEYQWRGSVKSRLIDKQLKNIYRKTNGAPFHAQAELYKYYRRLIEPISPE
jgi:polyphosphate kinase